MKKPTRRRPEVEALEALHLLSTLTPSFGLISTFTPATRPTLAVVGHASPTTLQARSPARLSAVALPGAANRITYLGGIALPPGTTDRPAVIGTASPSTPAAQGPRRIEAIGSGSSSGLGKGGTVHAMIVEADSRPVLIGGGSMTAEAKAAPAPRATPALSVGHGSSGLKLS